MAALKAKARRRDPSVEYSVYIFHRPHHQNDNYICWEKRHTTWSMRVAYRMAEKLFKTEAYDRVEIKKKFFDRKAARNIDKTLKIFGEEPARPVGMYVGMALVLAAVCAFTILYCLSLRASL